MYFSDEDLQELGAYYETREPEEEPVTEADYYALDRESDIRQIECPHENTSEELGGQVQRNGAVELYMVCHDCGATRPTGHYDSIL